MVFDLDEVFGKEGAKIKMHEIIHLQDQRIEELEEQLKYAIIPKFKKGQEVFYINRDNKIVSGIIHNIRYDSAQGIDYYIPHLQLDCFRIKEESVFATKEEAELEKKRWKLKNM
jgi:hypothetical protein